jgi:hypothetical protein
MLKSSRWAVGLLVGALLFGSAVPSFGAASKSRKPTAKAWTKKKPSTSKKKNAKKPEAGEKEGAGVRIDFDNPGNAKSRLLVRNAQDLVGRVSFNPFSGKYVNLGVAPEIRLFSVPELNDGAYFLLYPGTQIYVMADGTGAFSNPEAEAFVKLYGGGVTSTKLVKLSGGYKGVLMSGPGSVTVQFGNDDVTIQVAGPPSAAVPGRDQPARILAVAMAISKELAETSPPGTRPADVFEPDPPTSSGTEPSVPPPDRKDPNPAKGINPEDAPKTP